MTPPSQECPQCHPEEGTGDVPRGCFPQPFNPRGAFPAPEPPNQELPSLGGDRGTFQGVAPEFLPSLLRTPHPTSKPGALPGAIAPLGTAEPQPGAGTGSSDSAGIFPLWESSGSGRSSFGIGKLPGFPANPPLAGGARRNMPGTPPRCPRREGWELSGIVGNCRELLRTGPSLLQNPLSQPEGCRKKPIPGWIPSQLDSFPPPCPCVFPSSWFSALGHPWNLAGGGGCVSEFSPQIAGKPRNSPL